MYIHALLHPNQEEKFSRNKVGDYLKKLNSVPRRLKFVWKMCNIKFESVDEFLG